MKNFGGNMQINYILKSKAEQEDVKRSKTVVLEECGKSNKILLKRECFVNFVNGIIS